MQALFDELGRAEDVVARLHMDPELTDPRRHEVALRLAFAHAVR